MVKKVLIAGRGALALLAVAALLGSGAPWPTEAVTSTSAAAQSVEAHLTAADGRTDENGTVLLQQGQSISAEICLAAAGAMQIGISCRIPAEQKRATVVQLTVGDAEPTTHMLYPGYRYAGQIGRDERGNDILPETRRDGEMRFVPLRRDGYLAGERYTVDLPAGTTAVRLTVTEGELELGTLCAFTEEQPAAYVPPTDENGGGAAVTIEAEQPSAVSSAVLLPVADRTSAATSPGEVGVTRLNTIGGTNWSTPGQWIEWQIPVEQAGWYAIALRVRQNTARGMQSLRRIRIDGRVPCAQLERYGFAYRRDWQAETLGDEDGPFWFWLDAGVHTLTMEVCMGDTAAIYDDLKATIARLNDLYLNIIKVKTPEEMGKAAANKFEAVICRKPGPIGAGSERENVVAGLICDGQHIHPSAVRMAFKLFPGRICLISDALRCCGMPDGQYTLGGQDVFLYGGVAKLANGTLAGSATNLYDCMRKAVEFGIPKEQAVLSATLIPARELGCENEIGSIAAGKRADFVVCDQHLNRKKVYL